MKGDAVMTKQELIKIVKSMDHSAEYRSYYQFAHNYLLHMQNNAVTDIEVFRSVIVHCKQNANSPNTKQALGVSGKGNCERIKEWCSYILNALDNGYLSKANCEELCGIFGYCAHLGR